MKSFVVLPILTQYKQYLYSFYLIYPFQSSLMMSNYLSSFCTKSLTIFAIYCWRKHILEDILSRNIDQNETNNFPFIYFTNVCFILKLSANEHEIQTTL